MIKNKSEQKERILPVDEVDKCWMLGIAWSSVYGLYLKGSQRTPEEELFLRHWLHLILNTCKEMEVVDDEVTSVLNTIDAEVFGGKPPTLTEKALNQFQTVFEAALRAKNPHYYGIFGSAANASYLRTAFEKEERGREKSRFADFRDFFKYLRPILSQEIFSLILSAMNRWDTEWQKWHQGKRAAPKDAELSELESNIHGILVGSIKATDLLRFRDRILSALVAGLVILVLGMTLFLSVLGIFRLMAPWLLSDLTFPAQMAQTKDLVKMLNDSLALLGALGVFTAGIGRFLWQVGREITVTYTLHLAKERLVHPTKPLIL